jgi:hypothetical protein
LIFVFQAPPSGRRFFLQASSEGAPAWRRCADAAALGLAVLAFVVVRGA